MRIVIQRVSAASVSVFREPEELAGATSRERKRIAAINTGMLLLIGVGVRDVTSAEGLTTPAAQIEKMLDKVADKIAGLRIFSDDTGKMNLNITQAGGSILAVSQFTLYADTSRGRRPGFQDAAPPVVAEEIYLRLVAKLRAHKIDVLTGQFGADMAVELCNNGPVTIVLEESPNP